MAEFKSIVITEQGQALMANALSGIDSISFTKIAVSDQIYADDQLEKLAVLNGVKQTVLIHKVTKINEIAVKIEAALTNEKLQTGYYMQTIGLYAYDHDNNEVLYGVMCAEVAGWMPPFNGAGTSSAILDMYVTVGNANQVSLDIAPGVYATVTMLDEVKGIAESKIDKKAERMLTSLGDSTIFNLDTGFYPVSKDIVTEAMANAGEAPAINPDSTPGSGYCNVLGAYLTVIRYDQNNIYCNLKVINDLAGRAGIQLQVKEFTNMFFGADSVLPNGRLCTGWIENSDEQLSYGSTSPARNSRVRYALDTKVNVSDVDANLSATSTNPIQSKAVYEAIQGLGGAISGDTVPIGVIMPVVNRGLPQGWLFCDGTEVSRSEYSELFDIIGTTYGAGDGSTTFQLPNEPNPLTYTKNGNNIQFSDHEPELYMIIKAKNVVPIIGGVVNALESENPTTDAPSIEQVNMLAASLFNRINSIVPNPNLLINADFQVWQRGTTFTWNKGARYHCDHWYTYINVDKECTITKVDNGLKFQSTDLTASVRQFLEKPLIEGYAYTLSASIDDVVHQMTFTAGEDKIEGWLRYERSIENNAPLDHLFVRFVDTNEHVINWMKLEKGLYATPFISRLYSEEIMECMRFYQKVTYCYSTTHAVSASLHNTLPLKIAMYAAYRISPLSSTFNADTINVASINYAYMPGGTLRFNVVPKASGFVRVYNEAIEIEGEIRRI